MDYVKRELQISPFQIRVFLGTFISMFVMVTLQNLGVRAPQFLVKPVPEPDAFSQIQPKLEKVENKFHLKKNTPLIAQTHAASEYKDANAYTVVDLNSGDVLLEKNLSGEVSIASLTKIMTAIVTLDLASPDERFTITERAAAQIPTKIGIVPGEQMEVRELLQAVMLTSANDAAHALKDGVDTKYGEKGLFIRAMNEKARILGLEHSHFQNPQGFDGLSHYSSAEDLAILTHYAMTQYPLFAEIVKMDYAFLPKNDYHKQFDLNNWNGLLGVYPNVSGVKIGNTEDAGKTTIVISEREGRKLMVVLLGAPGILERDLWAAQLLDAGFKQSAGLAAVNVTEEALREKYQSWKYFN